MGNGVRGGRLDGPLPARPLIYVINTVSTNTHHQMLYQNGETRNIYLYYSQLFVYDHIYVTIMKFIYTLIYLWYKHNMYSSNYIYIYIF